MENKRLWKKITRSVLRIIDPRRLKRVFRKIEVNEHDIQITLIKKEIFNICLNTLIFLITPITLWITWRARKILKKFFSNLLWKDSNHFLICPIRGVVGTKIYDEGGEFTEEYHRIGLIKAVLKNGVNRKLISLNQKIRIGHKGKNSFIPDLVVNRKEGKTVLVVEVKKNSNDIKGAIEFQLNPAMKMLDSKYGIYYDGTENSIFIDNQKKIKSKFNLSSNSILQLIRKESE